MKISQKILALGGVALADYACCPYDDYGIPDTTCTAVLKEKTPFSEDGDAWVTDGVCKAWEANIDATFDGASTDTSGTANMCQLDNWGGCGFQRHFKWEGTIDNTAGTLGSLGWHTMLNAMQSGSSTTAAHTLELSLDQTIVPLGTNEDLGITYTNSMSISMAIAASGGNGMISADPQSYLTLPDTNSGTYTAQAISSSDSNMNIYNFAASPFLGGICKLFVPVPHHQINQVQIAGVHVSGVNQSVFAARMKTEPGGGDPNAENEGTAFCFSVVNPAEGQVNTNNVHNGNVYGTGAFNPNQATSDIFIDSSSGNSLSSSIRQNPTDASPDTIKYGEKLNTATGSGNAAGSVSSGANFDVTVHLSNKFCEEGYGSNIVEMQLSGDANQGDADYYYSGSSTISQTHAHNDVVDKRHNTVVAYNSYYASAAAGTADEGYLTRSGARVGKWPNKGAYAAFYSFVMCANPTDTAVSTAASANNESGGIRYITNAQNHWAGRYVYANFGTAETNAEDRSAYQGLVHGSTTDTITTPYTSSVLFNRMLAVSVSDNDFRQDGCADGSATGDRLNLSFRGNLRQVGDHVENCGPGQLPSNSNKRCTWNWNYSGAWSPADTPSATTNYNDPESYYNRFNQVGFDDWSARKRRDALVRGSPEATQLVNTRAPLQKVQIGLELYTNLGVPLWKKDTGVFSTTKFDATPETITITVDSFQDHTDTSLNLVHALTNSYDTPASCTNACTNKEQIIVVECQYSAWASGSTQHTSLRDSFPVCYQGDEIHFTATSQVNLVSQLDVPFYISGWETKARLLAIDDSVYAAATTSGAQQFADADIVAWP